MVIAGRRGHKGVSPVELGEVGEISVARADRRPWRPWCCQGRGMGGGKGEHAFPPPRGWEEAAGRPRNSHGSPRLGGRADGRGGGTAPRPPVGAAAENGRGCSRPPQTRSRWTSDGDDADNETTRRGGARPAHHGRGDGTNRDGAPSLPRPRATSSPTEGRRTGLYRTHANHSVRYYSIYPPPGNPDGLRA